MDRHAAVARGDPRRGTRPGHHPVDLDRAAPQRLLRPGGAGGDRRRGQRAGAPLRRRRPGRPAGRRDPGAGRRRGRLAPRAGGALDRRRRRRRGAGAAVRAGRGAADHHPGARHLRGAARRPHPADRHAGERLWADLGVEAFPSDARAADPAGPPRRRRPRHDRRPRQEDRRPAALVRPVPADRPDPAAGPVPPHRGCREPPAPAAHRALRAGRRPGGPAPVDRQRRGGPRRPRRRAVVGGATRRGRDHPRRHRAVPGPRRGRGRLLDGAPPPRGAAGRRHRSAAGLGRSCSTPPSSSRWRSSPGSSAGSRPGRSWP